MYKTMNTEGQNSSIRMLNVYFYTCTISRTLSNYYQLKNNNITFFIDATLKLNGNQEYVSVA